MIQAELYMLLKLYISSVTKLITATAEVFSDFSFLSWDVYICRWLCQIHSTSISRHVWSILHKSEQENKFLARKICKKKKHHHLTRQRMASLQGGHPKLHSFLEMLHLHTVQIRSNQINLRWEILLWKNQVVRWEDVVMALPCLKYVF